MLQRKISQSHDVAELIARVGNELGIEHGPFSALLFTWCVSHVDVAGRMHGDPRLVRAQVFPLIEQITAVHVGVYLKHMHQLGLVHWYEVEGRWWLAFPKFKDNQPNLRAEKETASAIPSPDCGVAFNDAEKAPVRRQLSAGTATEVEEKRKEVEGKRRSAPKAPPTEVYQVVEAWKTGWVERFKPSEGRAPEPNDPDWKQAKNLLAAHGLTKTLELVVRFLDDTDKLVAERGHMLRDLPSRVARYAKGDGPLFRNGNQKPRDHVEEGYDALEEFGT